MAKLLNLYMNTERIIIIILLFSLKIQAQYLEMSFIDPFIDNDLSSKNINCITQDSTGYIWIGTRNGLNRFDGYHVNIYQHNYIDTTTLLSHDIRCLYADSKGRLWIGANTGLCLYNPLKDNFKRFSHVLDSCGLNGFEIITMNEDKFHNFYIANASSIFILDELSQEFKHVYTVDKGEISSFVFDNNNNIWIGTFKEGGLIKIEYKNQKVKKYFKEDHNNSISNNSPVKLAVQNNKLWIATYEGGINCLDLSNEKFSYYLNDSEYEKYARFIYVDNNNRVWSSDITSLKIYDPIQDAFLGYYPNQSDPYSIKNLALGIFQDKQGNYWTYHANEGICLRAVPKGFNYFNTEENRFWYTNFKSISTICEDGDENLWMGNPSNGINIFRWSQTKIDYFSNNPNNPFSLGAGTIHIIYRDSKSNMWVGSHMGGLQYYDQINKRFVSYRHDNNNPKSIANNDIRSISEDDQGNFWIVTHGKGIDRLDTKTNTFQHYTKSNSNLSNDYAFQVLYNSKGDVWVATIWGLSVLKKGSLKFRNFYHYPDISTSISDNEINCIYEDSYGKMWFGTGKGLSLYNPEDSSFIQYKDGFDNSNIGSILIDESGMIWVGTPNGISSLDTSTNKVQNFDMSDGLISNEIFPRSAYKNKSNTFFFGGVNGLILFDPEKLVYNNTPPKVIIDKLKLSNKETTPGNSDVLDKVVSLTKNITLTYDQKVITFGYTAFNYINPYKNRYKFKMVGFDKDWIDAGNTKEVTYTNLDPGKYTFQVIASNNDDVWNLDGASINLVILPPWWERFWFRILIVLLITGAFILFYLIRVAQLRNQKSILEQLVKERTQELLEKNELLEKQTKDLNDFNTLLEERQQHIEEQAEELKSQAEKLSRTNKDLEQANATKNKLFSIIAHDLKDPFNTILGFSDYLSDEFDSLDDKDKIKISKTIRNSSRKVHTLLDNLLKWSRSQTNALTLNKQEINVSEVINNSYGLFKENIENKKIEIVLNVPQKLKVFADENTIQTVIRNLINNAIKFTPQKGTIQIKAEENKSSVIISISDTGLGMSQNEMDHLFQPEKIKVSIGTNGEKGSGLGLLICKEFIDLNNGKISVSSKPGKGSTFSITLPLLT